MTFRRNIVFAGGAALAVTGIGVADGWLCAAVIVVAVLLAAYVLYPRKSEKLINWHAEPDVIPDLPELTEYDSLHMRDWLDSSDFEAALKELLESESTAS